MNWKWDDLEPWQREWTDALADNLENLELRVIATTALPQPFNDVRVRAWAAAWWTRQVLPYDFDPGRNDRVLSLVAARRRGYGACADGSASVAAAALLARAHEVDLCYEVLPRCTGDNTYAHARVVVDGDGVDPYPRASYDVARCAERLPARELLACRRAHRASARP